MIHNSQTSPTSLDVVGIGNAIVDILSYTTDLFLESNLLKKGNMTLINEAQAEKIYSSMGPSIESSGGSVANTLAGIAQLGGNTGFIGRVKNDKLGDIFTREIINSGTFFKPDPIIKGPSTARCLILVTPDAERTMCTYLGASVLIEPKDLDISIIKNAKILYLEGYLFDNESAKNTFYTASKVSKESNTKVALSLSDSFCVKRHRQDFLELINNHIDILFANESEIIALFESPNLEAALNELSGKCDLSAITCGENGSIILTKEDKFKINSYNLGKVIDTTGAGDLFASGFLYGYLNNKNLITCGKIGSICAGKIITQLGSRSQVPLKDLIKMHL